MAAQKLRSVENSRLVSEEFSERVEEHADGHRHPLGNEKKEISSSTPREMLLARYTKLLPSSVRLAVERTFLEFKSLEGQAEEGGSRRRSGSSPPAFSKGDAAMKDYIHLTLPTRSQLKLPPATLFRKKKPERSRWADEDVPADLLLAEQQKEHQQGSSKSEKNSSSPKPAPEDVLAIISAAPPTTTTTPAKPLPNPPPRKKAERWADEHEVPTENLLLAEQQKKNTEEDDVAPAIASVPPGNTTTTTTTPAAKPGYKRRDLAALYGGGAEAGKKGPVTSLMVRHLPCRCEEEEVLGEIREAGFAGEYDFFYMPREKRQGRASLGNNLGYVFINFTSPEAATRFWEAFQGHRFGGQSCRSSQKECAISVATVQGLQNNWAQFQRTAVLRSERRPAFFPRGGGEAGGGEHARRRVREGQAAGGD